MDNLFHGVWALSFTRFQTIGIKKILKYKLYKLKNQFQTIKNKRELKSKW